MWKPAVTNRRMSCNTTCWSYCRVSGSRQAAGVPLASQAEIREPGKAEAGTCLNERWAFSHAVHAVTAALTAMLGCQRHTAETKHSMLLLARPSSNLP